MSKKESNKVLCIGFTTVDQVISGINAEQLVTKAVYPAEDCSFSVGGDAANEAVVLARLGVDTALCTKLGGDFLKNIVLDYCEKAGVDMSKTIIDPSIGTTMGIALIGDKDSRRIIPVAKGRSTDCLCEEDIKTEWFSDLKAISFASLFVVPKMTMPVLSRLFAAAKAAGCIVCCDVKMEGTEKIEDMKEVLPYVDYIFPNFAEARSLTDEKEPLRIAQRFLDYGTGCVVLKLGVPGCLVKTKEEEYWIPSYKVQSVDSTGAGDNFAAGFIAGIVTGETRKESAKIACAASSVCVQNHGATAGVYDMDTLKAIVKAGEEGWEERAAKVADAWEKEEADSFL